MEVISRDDLRAARNQAYEEMVGSDDVLFRRTRWREALWFNALMKGEGREVRSPVLSEAW